MHTCTHAQPCYPDQSLLTLHVSMIIHFLRKASPPAVPKVSFPLILTYPWTVNGITFTSIFVKSRAPSSICLSYVFLKKYMRPRRWLQVWLHQWSARQWSLWHRMQQEAVCGIFPRTLEALGPLPASHVADRVLVLRLGVRPVPLRWESWVQDIGPPETSRLHVVSNGKSSPRDLHLNAKTQLHSMTSKLQCWTPYAKQLAKQEHNPTHQQRGCLKS